MLRYRLLLCLAALPLLAVQSLLAATVQVGTCRSGLASFTTISAAVSLAPASQAAQPCLSARAPMQNKLRSRSP